MILCQLKRKNDSDVATAVSFNVDSLLSWFKSIYNWKHASREPKKSTARLLKVNTLNVRG